MKKLLKVLAVALFALVPLSIVSTAQAQLACDIGFTGPDSNNQCTSVAKYTCNVTNTNVVDIKGSNDQSGASGPVVNSSNNQSGSSTSGTVTNTNGTTFAVTITNANPQVSDSGTCTASIVKPAADQPVPAVVRPTEQGGGGSVGGGGGAVTLPDTSGDFTPTILLTAVGSLATLAALGVGGVALYRYYKSL